MSDVFCVLKTAQFKEAAKRLNLSDDALERIVHNYINTVGDANAFPSDSYIKAQYAIENVVSKADLDSLTTIWEEYFSSPIVVDNLQEAILFRDEATKYFKESAVSIMLLHNGTFRVTVAAPKVATVKSSQETKEPIVYNKEQLEAIDAAVKHIDRVRAGVEKQKFFTIQGKAGTGKTTIVNEILSRMKRGSYSRPLVLMGAHTHKATTVLKGKLNADVVKNFDVQNKTIAGMLGMKPVGNEFAPIPGQVPPIQRASVVFIDEASMVSEQHLELILEALKNKHIPVIFLGDAGQLPPVRKGKFFKGKKIASDKISPVFEDKTIPSAKLVTRVRQGEDSPVLDYADGYWNFSQGKSNKYPNDLKAKSRITDRGALIIQREEVDLVQQLLPLFQEAKRTGNPNLVKIVAYTKNSNDGKESAVDRYNRLIREKLYPNSTTTTFEKGDLIIFNETYGNELGSIPNSFEAAVEGVRPCESSLPQFEGVELEEVERIYLTLSTPSGHVEVPALVPTLANKLKHQRNLEKIAKYCEENKRSWPRYYEYKQMYAADINYAYAIGDHKSQGSTYEVVAVDVADINGVQPTSLTTKAQGVYTALTRASNVTIVSSNTTNEGTIYTDIKSINDRINAVKSGAEVDEEFTPETEEDVFTEVTENDLDTLIKDPNKKLNRVKKKGEVSDLDVNPLVENSAAPTVDDEDLEDAEDWDEDEDEKPSTKATRAPKETPQERTYREFTAAQKQLSSIIKFKKASHTYYVNGVKADFSVTEFKDFLLERTKNTNDFLEISSRLGDAHDAFLRDYFAGEVKDSYPNLSEAQIKKLTIQAAKLEALLEKTFGEDAIFITDEDYLRTACKVTYDGEEYTIAGTMDMVVIDNKGNIHIVDFKTKRANKSEEFDDDQREGYAVQISLYKASVASNSLFKTKMGKTQLAQFNVRYADPRTNNYSFKGNQVYIEIDGEDVKLQEAVKDNKVPYTSGVFTNKLLGLSVDLSEAGIEVSQIKTGIQSLVGQKEENKKTSVEPAHFKGQMVEFYGKQKRADVKAASTLGAVLEGKRTATTRTSHWEYWKDVKVGDIITFHDVNGKTVQVRVTVAPHKLSKDLDLEEWSKKEGWTKERFTETEDKNGKTLMDYTKEGKAFQMEFELIEKEKPSSIEIISTSKKYGLLSNFGEKEFKIDGKTFPTVEHYFHWAKAVHCKNFAMANRILKASSAKQAKYLGSHVLDMNKEQQKSWDKISRKVMTKGIREALEQNDDAKALLMSTGTAMLTHKLGGPMADILMELREEFGGAGKPTTIKEAEKKAKEDAKKAKEVPVAPSKKATVSNSNFIESKGDYPQRTKENAEWSDITLDFTESDKGSGGRNELTKRVAGKKYVHFQLHDSGETAYDADEILKAINDAGLPTENIKLNIAGSEIGKLKHNQDGYNEEITRIIRDLQDLGVTISEIRSGGQTGIDEAGIIAAQRLGIKWSVNAPKGWKFRDAEGVDHEGEEEAFKARFGSQSNEWTRRGDKQLKISTEGYRKEDPKDNPNVAYVFTENAQAASNLYEGAQGYASEVEAQNPKLKLTVSDAKGTNQAGIRMGSDGKAYPNTYGIVVKKRQQDENGNWLSKEGQFEDTDEDFEIFKEFNNFFFDRLSEASQKKIIFPSQMALGKAALPKRFAEWLAEELKTRYGVISTIKENENSSYEGYGLSIDSIQEKKVDSNLHVEKISDRYTPKTSSDVEQFNTAAEALRKQGWHVEFYSKKSKDGSITNEAMTISIEGNPKKGFFELVKDQEEDNYSVHFKTKSKKAMNESEFAEEALEDSEKEDMFKALIYAIPEGGTVSTWGTLSKGGISALDNLAKRSGGSLQKIGDKLAKDSEDKDTRIPVYKKLTEDEIAAANIAKARKVVAVRKENKLPEFKDDFYGLLESTEKDDRFTSMVTITFGDPSISVADGSKNSVLDSLIKNLPYSSLLTLSQDRGIDTNFLYTLNEMLNNSELYAVPTKEVITIDPKSEAGWIAAEYAKKNKKLQYNPETGELHVPKFTLGYSISAIEKKAAYNRLINNDLLTQEELRSLSKATMYKLSEIITMIQSNINGYRKWFGEDGTENAKKDFTKMSRIEIIQEIGLKTLLLKVRERVFDPQFASTTTSRSTIKKMKIIKNNWEAFVELGYDTLIGLEEIALDSSQEIKNDLNTDEEEDESIVQEIFGSSIEHWQVGFRQVSAFSSLSKSIKRVMDSLYELDENGEKINDEFRLAKHLDAQTAVSKILYFTQGAQSLDEIDASGDLRTNSMLYMLKQHVNAEPWLQQVIELLEGKVDDEGNVIKPADEQFKAQFYSNFKKYFQKYAITFKKKVKDSGASSKDVVLIKIINESQYSDVLLKESQAKENSFATGGFKLKTKEGAINTETLNRLKKVAKEIQEFSDTANNNKGKIGELVNLDVYHKALVDVFDLLDISTPPKESLYNLFGVKKNLKNLNQHLGYLVDAIKDGIDVTSNRDYKQIVSLVAKEMGLEMESVSYEAGKMYYSYVLPSYLGRLITKLKSDNMSDAEYNEFLQKEYLRYNWFNKDGKVRCHWLDRLRRSKEARENFEHVTSLHYLGTDYSSKSPMEYIASMMRMYFFDNNKKWAYFRVPMLSNKPSEEYIKFERIHVGYKDTIVEYMLDIFTQEIDRIQAVRERQENINKDQKITSKGKKETFDKRGLEFVFEDYLQKYKDGTYKDRQEYKNLSDKEKAQEAEFSKLLNAKLDGTISETNDDYGKLLSLFKIITKRGIDERYQIARQTWVDEGFLTLNADGTIKSIAGGMKLGEKDLNEFFWNDMFASIQILELTITDEAYYVDAEDLQKRLAQLHAPGMQAHIYAKDRHGNLYTKDGIERTMYVKDDMIKSHILKNLEIAKEQIAAGTPIERRAAVKRQLESIIKAFEDINFADAQGYSCPSSYRKKMGIFGNWDDRMEDAYEKVIHPEKYPDVNLSDMLDVLWQPLKPFVYTQIAKPGYNSILPEIKQSVQNKNSEYVLVIADALLTRAGRPNKLRAIYEFMEASQHNSKGELNGEGIDTVQFMSAVNAGCTGVIDLNDTLNSDGSITYLTEDEIQERLSKAYAIGDNGEIVYSKDYVHEIPFEDYIIQQNVPAHFMKHEQAHGSQDRILTFADMLDNDPITGEPNYLEIDGKKVTVKQAKEDYFKAVADNIERSKQELIRRFKLDTNPRAINVAISEVLKDTILKDSRYGSDLLWACDTNEYGEFNIPLSDPTQSTRIQQLLNSIIKNTINKQEIAGGPVVQVSNWGASDRLNIRFKNNDGELLLTEREFNGFENKPDDYDSVNKEGKRKWKSTEGHDSYESYIKDQSGVAYYEALVPIPDDNFAKDFIKKDAQGNEYIDVKEIEKTNPDLLYMVGYRIPTESKYSMVPIKVKGFLPRVGGEGIMLPAEITKQAGSDFDIDKLYIMKYTFNRYEKGGKVIYEKPESGRGYNNNLIVSTQLAVLQSEQVQKQFFTPGNFDEPKKYGYLISYVQKEAAATGKDPEEIWDEAVQKSRNMSIDDFNDWLKGKNKTTKNLIYNDVQVQFHKQNMTAGKLIGIFAQANVSHAFISLVEDTVINVPEDQSFTINGIHVGQGFEVDSILSRDKEVNISNNLAALLAASVDAVKDPILNLINININTANMVTAMLRMGFSLETVSLLVSQPVIKNLVRDHAIRNAEVRTVDMDDLIQEAIQAIPEDIREVDEISVESRDLIANLNGESAITNYMVLKIFQRMQEISDTFGDITHMTRYNSVTAAVGPFASDTMLQRTKDAAFRGNPMIGQAIKDACDNPILSAFRDSADYIERKLLGEHLIQAGTKFETALDTLGKRLGYSRGVPAKVASAFSDFYMSFYVNDSERGSVFDLGYDNRKYMLTQFPKDFLRLKKKYKDNLLINSIQYAESDREQYPFLQLKTRGLNSTVLEDMKNAWITLFEDPNSRDLAVRIAEYNYFRGSFGFNPKTFMNLVPNIIKSNLNNYISVLNSRNSRVETLSRTDMIINQFILHKPELIKDRYYKLENYSPIEIIDDEYGECLQVSRKSDAGGKDNKYFIRETRPLVRFIKIDSKTYYVAHSDSDYLILKEVDELGGDGQGFEISVDEVFPKSIYDNDFRATKKDGKDTDDSPSRGNQFDERALGVIIDQLFEEDEIIEMSEMRAKKAIDRINDALEGEGYDIRIPQTNRIQVRVAELLEQASVAPDVTELLNKADETIDDLNLCSR